MTATEVARRSDALYEDNSGGMTRRTLCDMVAQREAEIEKLRDENQSIGMAAYELGRNSMADENAKLRELLDYMTPIAWYAASERERDRMRELGVEAEQ